MKTYKKEGKIHSRLDVLRSTFFVVLLVFFGLFLPVEYDWGLIELWKFGRLLPDDHTAELACCRVGIVFVHRFVL